MSDGCVMDTRKIILTHRTILGLEQHRPNLSLRYVYGIQSGQFIKVGVTTKMASRLNEMRLYNPHPLTVVLRRRMRGAYHCEKKMHEILKDKSIGREWFTATAEEVRAAAEVGAINAKEKYMKEAVEYIQWQEAAIGYIHAQSPNENEENEIKSIACNDR